MDAVWWSKARWSRPREIVAGESRVYAQESRIGNPLAGTITEDIEAARSGDAEAMERLLLPYEGMLKSLCARMLGNVVDAEDAVQETFLQALRSLHRYRGDAKFSTWLTQIAVHVCADGKRKRRPHVSLTDWDEDRTPASTHPARTPEQVTVNRLLMQEALQTLRPDRRAAIILREIEEWSLEEIGRALGWNTPRVKTELYRSRLALAEWLRRHGYISSAEEMERSR